MNWRHLAFFTLLICLSCEGCKEDCYEDPQILVPAYVQNIKLTNYNAGPTYVGHDFYPFGLEVWLYGNSPNLFFSLKRTDAFGQSITFFWNPIQIAPFNANSTYPFSLPQLGEIITVYIAVQNMKQTINPECSFKEAKTVKSIIDVVVKVQNGQIIATKQVVQTQYNVPAGQYAVFPIDIEYEGPDYNYDLGMQVDVNGKLISEATISIPGFSL